MPETLDDPQVCHAFVRLERGEQVPRGIETMTYGNDRLPFRLTPRQKAACGALTVGLAATVSYVANGTNAAKSPSAMFVTPGIYELSVTITDAQGLSTTSTTSATVALGGDATLDGHVDVADLLTLARSCGNSGNWSSGDFNDDGNVGVADLLVLARNYGHSTTMAVTTTTLASGSSASFSGTVISSALLAPEAVPAPATRRSRATGTAPTLA